MAKMTKQVEVNIGKEPLESYRRTATLTLINVVGYARLTLEFLADPSPLRENGRPRTLGDGSLRYIGRCKGYVNRRFVGNFNLIQSGGVTYLQVLN